MFCEHNFFLTLLIFPLLLNCIQSFNQYTRDDLYKFREEVREMFNHAYSGYLKHAYPYDELRPLTCDGVHTWGSYSLTLIDALDTLIIMGNYTEFKRAINIITETINFDININVSVFETNIRIVGGLLSAHILSHKAGIDLEPGWPCDGPLLRLADDVAKRLLPAFDTATGMPYGTVNLRKGVPAGETSITCTAGIGTYILEFGTLTRLTGDPIYEKLAMNALRSLFQCQSKIGLLGNHIDVVTGVWTALDSGIGAGIDSYFEYLVKGAILFNKPELMSMFSILQKSINKYLKHNDWYFWVSMQKGSITLPLFQSLEAYWPGVLSLIGNMNESMKSIHNYHTVWKRYGFTPEFYNIIQQEVSTNRESYPLRPELIESVMYLYRATGDPYLLDVGVDILKSIQHSAITPCGFATIKDCRDHSLDNRMESFFLAETTKYLYLLFDTDNFIHNTGSHGKVIKTLTGQTCVIDSGGYIFNTEAHPIDPGILHCCNKTSNFFMKNMGIKNNKKKNRAREKEFRRNVKTLSGHVRSMQNLINIPSDINSSNDTFYNLKRQYDKEIFDDLNELYTHITTKQKLSKADAADEKKYRKNTIRKFGNPASHNACNFKDLIEHVFLHTKNDQTGIIGNIKQKITSWKDEIRSFKDYLLNKTEFTTKNYDYESILNRIRKERNIDKFKIFTTFKILYCQPQPFLQRLSFLGQFFGNP